jgi:hypothetical protein
MKMRPAFGKILLFTGLGHGKDINLLYQPLDNEKPLSISVRLKFIPVGFFIIEPQSSML